MPNTKGQHTPGPWESIGASVHSDGREIVCGLHNTRSADDAERRANARLIAQAPAMLQALDLAAEALAGCISAIEGEWPGEATEEREAHRAIVSVIAAARGEEGRSK